MGRIFIFFAIFFLGFLHRLHSQSFNCPEIKIAGGVDTMLLDCNTPNTCTTISATLPDIRQTINGANAYLVSSIPFSEAQTFNLPNPTQILVNIDDRYSSAITLPFTFCFYGNNFDRVVVGANGTITFNTAYASAQSGYQMCNENNNQFYQLPQSNRNSFPLNAIYALFHDIDPSINNGLKKIEWQVIGTAPCRKMVINYIDISQYRGLYQNACINHKSTFQCVLYENTNVIDIFVKEKPLCTSWNCGAAVIGVQNNAGNQAVTPPNRNTSQFEITTSTSEGWRFIPNGASLLVNNQVQLLDANRNLVQTITPSAGTNGIITANFTTPICITGTNTTAKFYVKANYLPCSGTSLEVLDSIVLKKNLPPTPIVTDTINYCRYQTATPLTAQGVGLRWYTTATGGTFSTTAPTPNTATPGLQVYYVASFNNNCESNRVPIYVRIQDFAYGTYTVDICQGDSLLFNGTYYKSTNNTAKDTFSRSAPLCDSIVTLHLTVKPKINHTVTITKCTNQMPFVWNNINITQAGNAVANVTFPGSNGCDSTTTLNVIVNPTKRDTVTLQRCETQMPFVWNGINITQAGIGVATFSSTTAQNCDSIVVLNLNVRDTQLIVENNTICYSSLPYTWRGITVNQAGNAVARRTYTNQYGCDSQYVLNLTVNNAILNTIRDTVCESDLPLSRHGRTVNAVGAFSFVDTFTSIPTNCDSIVTWSGFVRNQDSVSVNVTICSSQLPYVWNGISVSAAGNRVATYTSSRSSGCDSTTFLNLTVNPSKRDTVTLQRCETQMPFVWNGMNITQGGVGVAIYTGSTAQNCDSIVVLNVSVRDTQLFTDNITVCYNALPYTWRGLTVAQGGNNVATKVYTNQYGCDSTFILNLTVTNAIRNTVAASICEDQLPYSINGNTVNAFGTFSFIDTFTSLIYNCDSIVTANITVLEKDTMVQPITICSNQLPFTWNGINVTQAGNNIARFTSSGSDGCDSVTLLNLTVHPVVYDTARITICQSQLPYVWNGTILNQGGNNVATYSGTSANNCDSIVTLHLTVIPTIRDTVTVVKCENQFPFMWNGMNITSGGNAVANYTATSAATNCDSITTLHVVVNDTIINRLNVMVCQSQMPYSWNGQTINTGGTNVAQWLGQRANGCDSLVLLSLQVINTVHHNQHVTICATQLPYMWNGISVTQGGTNVAQFTNTVGSGCDSITHLNLTVTPTIHRVVNVSISANALPYMWNGISVNAFGDTVATYTTTSPRTNCDSVTYLRLLDLPVKQSVDSMYICYTNTPYIYGNISITATGAYTATFTGVNGCDSIVGLYAQVGNAPIHLPDTNLTACGALVFRNQTYYSNTVIVDTTKDTKGCNSLYQKYAIHILPTHTDTIVVELCHGENYNFNGTTYSATTMQTVYYKNQYNCDSTITLNLTVHPLPELKIDLKADDRICVNDEMQLIGSGAQAYQWYINGRDYGTDNPLVTRVFEEQLQVKVIGTSAFGCVDSTILNIVGEICCEVGIPNAFSPNGDGLNEGFGVISPGVPTRYLLKVFDRWGKLVFQSNNIQDQWDGTSNGNPCDVGVYFYYYEYECVNGSVSIHKGDVTLLR